MSQFQPNAAPGRSFIERINSKFSNLKLSEKFTESDGSTEDDTLIHNAFVRFFDSRQEPYPEWLGAKSTDAGKQYLSPWLTLTLQPVRASYNAHPVTPSHVEEEEERPTTSRARSSRLQELYQKSRQQSSTSTPTRPLGVSRTNTAGTRIRERVMNGESHSTWNR